MVTNPNTLIFLEETCLHERNLYPIMEEWLKNDNLKSIEFYLDDGIKDSLIQNKSQSNAISNFYFEGFLDLLESTKKVKFIETKSYFDFSLIEGYLTKSKYSSLIFVTQKESVFLNIFDLIQKYPMIKATKIGQMGLIEWIKTINPKLNAFYVEKELFTHSVDTSSIDHVYSPKYGYLKLFKDKIYSGGEGSIYKTHSNQLCKIYHKDHISYINHKKLLHMIEMDNFNPNINWPKDVIYHNGSFVGYLMDEIKDAIALDDLRIEGFNGLTLINRYEIAYNLLVNIEYLHQKNIVVGDLKLDNILIKLPNRVFLIDSGSYQVSDYPCTVYHPEYTKKKYTEEELRKFLRTPEDEYYPINMIIFEILIGKKPNYDPNNTEIDSDRDVFKYPLDVSKINDKSPMYLRLWAIMSTRMREMFYYYFTQSKVSYLPEWIQEIKIVIEANKQ